MASIPLPALGIKTPEQPDILGQLSRLQALRGMAQQQQIQQQTQQENQLKIQQQQQQQQDQKIVMDALGQTGGDMGKAIPMLAGKVTPATLQGLQKFDIEHRKALSDQTKADNEAAADRSSKLAALTAQAGQLPDDQYAQAWPQIAAQAVEIEPKLKDHVNPAQPIPKAQLANLQIGFLTQAQYHSQAAEVRAQQAQEETKRHNVETEQNSEGKQFLADARFRSIKEAQRLGAKISDQDKAFLGAYEDQKKAAQPYGAARIEIARENADRKDLDYIDKTYVKPANDAEKSYQMFMEAYNNRDNAKTGAESMLALSTHLATTFGNVKGARVTKDMIQEHLGARGISDSALVAVQKLSNGDALSPDQWDAFKGLISNSRKLSWDAAQKEADRRKVDISGSLPADLKKSAAGSYFDQYPTH